MTTGHLEDGTLIRHQDGECDPIERESVVTHLRACDECHGRLQLMTRRAARLRALLGAMDQVRTGRGPARRLVSARALATAATIALLVGAAAVRPVRAWIVEQTQALWALVTGAVPEGGAPEPSATPDEGAYGSVSFPIEGSVLTVEVAGYQLAGGVTVTVGPGGFAAAGIDGGALPGAFVVLPARLRLVNDATSSASYRLSVPAGVRRVEVTIAGVPVAVFETGKRGDSLYVSLVEDGAR
jgi:hypothetical protein